MTNREVIEWKVYLKDSRFSQEQKVKVYCDTYEIQGSFRDFYCFKLYRSM